MGGSQTQQQLGQVPQPEPSASRDRTDDPTEVALVHRALQAIRDEFEDSTWMAFWKMTVEGHCSAEIADELGMTKSAVRQAKYRVLRRLRQELQ